MKPIPCSLLSLYLLGGSLVAAAPIHAADWKPADSPLMTRWGKNVTPENAWREYPRPQMVRTEWQCLNGLWDYAITGKDGEWKQPPAENEKSDPLDKEVPLVPTDWSGKVLVPFAIDSALSGVRKFVRPNQLLWYQRRFEVPANWSGQKLLLHFDAVDWHTIVWVNGKKMGENKGGYNRFSFDITDALKPAGPQTVTLVVWDPSSMGDQAAGKQSLPEHIKGFRYTCTTGIWQPVWLEPVPAASIDHLVITPQVDKGAVEVTVNATGTASSVELEVFDGDKQVAKATGKAGAKISIHVPKAKLWSPESPFLYDLKIKMGADAVTSYFGMRKIEVKPDAAGVARIWLNGKEVFMWGPLDQGYWPDGGLTPPSDEAQKADLQYLKDIGCNMDRVHIKVNDARWYYWADHLGLLVLQDFVCMHKHGPNTATPYAQWMTEMKREVDHLYNHPSIVEWIVFNEGWGQHDSEEVINWTIKRDPSRVICGATGWVDVGLGNFYDIHDYTFHTSIARPGELGARAMTIGECGGFNLMLPGHTWGNYPPMEKVDEIGEGKRESYASAASWEPRYAIWLQNLQLLRSLGLCAAVYTQITDVERECNGWLTYDRAESKIPVDRLRQMHERLRLPPPTLTPLVPMIADAKPAAAFKKGSFKLPAERRFTLTEIPKSLAVRLDGEGLAKVYINGELVKAMSNSDRAGYVPTSMGLLSPKAMKALRIGENILKLETEPALGGKKKKTASGGKPSLDVGIFAVSSPN